MHFDFFVVHHAGTVRAITGTANWTNVTRNPHRLNNTVRFKFLQLQSIDTVDGSRREFISPFKDGKRKDDTHLYQ